MNKKIYTAPEMETIKIQTQRVIASSSLEAGKYNNDGEGSTSEQPDVDGSGTIFGD